MKLFLLLDIHFQEIIAEGENETYFAKPCVVVGKLNIKEADFFEKKEEQEEKPVVNIGKLDASGLFNPACEEKDTKFYKPIVQPKKMKLQNLFPESSENTNTQALLNNLCCQTYGTRK